MTKENISTSERILDVTEGLIQSRGYSAISFNDIAEKVGIKKPSILYHYQNKSVLGVAVVNRYRKKLESMLDGILSEHKLSATQILDVYFSPYLNLGKNKEKICLCGALAGEYMALPKNLQAEITLFYQDNKKWLLDILTLGKSAGDFSFDGDPEAVASLVLDTLQGSLVMSRATSDLSHVEKTIVALKRVIGL
ncbi:MAG: TetR/AcrR family transcriptional regulator [Gammaproteobacteria bacterium]|nr:TetR/AcrR family transcriptional regulator [Gammaproteobacteria bacterium]